MQDFQQKTMFRAIALARKGIGRTSPNPAVGCVIVRDGEIAGEGWHRKAGTPHAEIHALSAAGSRAFGADVYVTLEPCSHFGKTPPCADALIAAGVARVFVGMVDPNPKVSGRGIEKLISAGIEVISGILEENCRSLNEPFIKHVTTSLPFVILKSAMTLDGKIATSSGDSKWITNEKSRRYVHTVRSKVDVLLTGVDTVIADDPLLTARIPGGKDPLRVIVDSSLRIPLHAKVLHHDSSAKTCIATISEDESRIAQLRETGAEVLSCSASEGRVDLKDLLAKLGARGVQSVLLEAGSVLASAAVRLGLIDKFLFFYAPKLLGGDGVGIFSGPGTGLMAEAMRLDRIKVRRFDDDILIEGYPEGACLRG